MVKGFLFSWKLHEMTRFVQKTHICQSPFIVGMCTLVHSDAGTIILLHLMALLCMIAISSQNDQYDCSVLLTSAFVNSQL